MINTTLADAIKSKNTDTIKTTIQAIWNSADRDSLLSDPNLKEHIIIKGPFDFMKEESVALTEVLIRNTNLAQEIAFFDIARELIDLGFPVPEPLKSQKEFSSTSGYLEHLANHAHDLFIAICNNPSIVNLQGEDGQTILHHSAAIGRTKGSNSASLIHHQLFNLKETDFNIVDNDGNTAVHIAAMHSFNRVTCYFIFPNFVKAATEKAFDFSTLNNEGYAVIHYATIQTYTHSLIGRRNNVANLLETAPDIDINVLSTSGATALYHAIDQQLLKEARSLLSAGASPSVYGTAEHNPMVILQEHINIAQFSITLIEANQSGQLSQFVEENKALLTSTQEEQSNTAQPNSDLELFTHNLANKINPYGNIYKDNLKLLQDLKQRMQNIIFNEQQNDQNHTFAFFGKTNDNRAWDQVNTQPNPLDDRSGPGYGF